MTAPETVSPPATPQRQSKPLLPLRGVTALVDKSKQEVLELIEEGEILWVWDVALSQRGGRKRELRILPAAVADYLSGRQCQLDWEDVLRLLLPHEEPVIMSGQISRILNISVTHVYDLARRKVLSPCSTWRAGRGGFARFPAKAFIDFLKARRVV
jgi:hypothetical protein